MALEQMIEDGFKAAQSGDVLLLGEVLKAYPELVNMENSDGLTLLGYAAHFGNEAAVQLLIGHGAEVNAVSHSKVSYIPSNTALHTAIAGERSLDVIRLLLNHQAEVNIFDSNGHTALHTAAFHDDNIELIRMLIEHGADVHARLEDGETTLSLALQQGNHNVAAVLRQHGTAE
ncbi:ankyrin repeat domain-containing protein [Paenibacillus sp. MMS18-CY102]|uniref:ankyrin repeat domain-containing protein n=1 Tax=Paenibacillus sp. MMS18-CY102 TaxID=2682849 RepID=UPI00136550FB|nr:ankyrin repeat domain-containing protein [Paenibacillus sp. MMS18-CY102]MWC27660.1 ankyrin repeat domain-containing protein [Paenibacillus sp. MMS18-CY102]